MLRVGATRSVFYYFRDFSAEKRVLMPHTFVRSVCAIGSMIDRREGEDDPPRGGSNHIQSLPAVFDICGDVYLQKGTLWLARSRSGPFSSRFFPRYAREETHRLPVKRPASCITVSLNFPRRDEAQYLSWYRMNINGVLRSFR